MKVETRPMERLQIHPRLYVFTSGENVIQNLMNRWNRPFKFYRTLLPAIFAAAGAPLDTKTRWNQRAGCGCGCSPGFILKHTKLFWQDIYVTLEPNDFPELQSGNDVQQRLPFEG